MNLLRVRQYAVALGWSQNKLKALEYCKNDAEYCAHLGFVLGRVAGLRSPLPSWQISARLWQWAQLVPELLDGNVPEQHRAVGLQVMPRRQVQPNACCQ